MGDGVTLYLLLWLLYLSECFVWVGKQSVALITPWWKKWRIGAPSSFIANSRGAALLLNPFFPARRALVCPLSPISVSPDGVCAFNAQTLVDRGRPVQTAHHFAFEDIESCATDDNHVRVNQKAFVDCSNAAEAQRLAAWIHQLMRTPAAQRHTAIRQSISRRLVKTEALSQLNRALASVRPLEIICSVFFLFLFLGAPALVFHFGLEAIIIPVAVAMVGFAAAIATLYFLYHKALWPEASAERVAAMVKIIFCPPGAINTVSHFTAHVLSGYDPLLAASLLPRDDEKRFASAYVRDLQFPVPDTLDPPAKKIVEWQRGEMLKQVMDYLRSTSDSKSKDFLDAPILEPGCHSYCPRCHNQFTVTVGECTSCDGVQLIVA